MSYKNGHKHKTNKLKKLKNLPGYLFNGNLIVNIKDFDSSLLKIYKLLFKGVFSVNIYYIKYIPTKALDHKRVKKRVKNLAVILVALSKSKT